MFEERARLNLLEKKKSTWFREKKRVKIKTSTKEKTNVESSSETKEEMNKGMEKIK